MILFGKKHIHKWRFWRKKSKIFYCITFGLTYAILMGVGSLLYHFLTGDTNGMIESAWNVALGAFIPVTFLSIAYWYENERRYKEWLKSKE